MIESWMRNGGFFGALAAAVGLGLAADAGAVAWTPTVDNSPDLHTTQLELAVELKAPVPATVTVDLAAMGQSTWRTTVPTQGHARVTAVLAPGDFQCVNPGKTLEPLRLGYTAAVALSTASIARLFEFKRYAIACETFRSLVLFGPLACGWWFHGVTPSAQGIGAVALLLSLWSLAMYQRELTNMPSLLPGTTVQEAT